MGSATSIVDGDTLDPYWPHMDHHRAQLHARSYAPNHMPYPGGAPAGNPRRAPDWQTEFPSPGSAYADPWLRAPTLQPSGGSLRGRDFRDALQTPAPLRSGLPESREAQLDQSPLPSYSALPYSRDPFDEPFHSKTSRFAYSDRALDSLSTASTADSYRFPSLGSSPVSPPSLAKPSTLLIFDWDDTLMCSSALNSGQFLSHHFVQLEALVEQVLTTSMQLGETIIVTNADEMWVSESTRRFIPRVTPLLSSVRVISARKMFEQSWPGDVFAWKREAFREVIIPWQTTAMSPGGMHLVVLGDSAAEMEAAHTSLIGLVSPSAVKTVKFREMPTAEELLEQLRVINQELPTIVAEERSSNRNLSSQLWLSAAPSPPAWSNRALPATAYGTMSMGNRFGVPTPA